MILSSKIDGPDAIQNVIRTANRRKPGASKAKSPDLGLGQEEHGVEFEEEETGHTGMDVDFDEPAAVEEIPGLPNQDCVEEMDIPPEEVVDVQFEEVDVDVDFGGEGAVPDLFDNRNQRSFPPVPVGYFATDDEIRDEDAKKKKAKLGFAKRFGEMRKAIVGSILALKFEDVSFQGLI